MPLNFFRLPRLLNRGTTSQRDLASPSMRLKPNPGTRILIVDDAKTTHVVLARLLKSHGYETLAAFDGESGIALAKEYRPALILMDVLMPGINGFQATRKLRRDGDPDVANIPIVIMSGSEQATEQFWSMKIGANGFLPKPFDEESVLDGVEQLLYPRAVQQKRTPADATGLSLHL